MRKIVAITVLFMLYLHSFGQGKDFVIYQDGKEYVAKEEMKETVLIKDKKADVVIQNALDKLKGTGGSVNLLSGKYVIEKQLQMPSHVTLSGRGSSSVLVIKKNAKIESAIYSDSTSKIIVKDLAIVSEDEKAEQSGIIFNHVGDCKILNLSVSGLGKHGIWLRENSFLNEISGCRFANCGGSAIFMRHLRHNGRGGDYVANLVTNCLFYGGNRGIELDAALCTNIIGCEFYMLKSYGIYLHDDSNSNLITGCRTFQLQDDAIRVVNSHELNISGNMITWHVGHAIVLEKVMWGNVNGNNIIDTGHLNVEPEDGDDYSYWVIVPEDVDIMANLKDGILMKNQCQGVTISGNAIFNWGSNPPLKYGIEEDETCTDNVITGNNINYYHHEGILANGKNTIVENNISEKEPFRGGANIEKRQLHRYDPRKVQKFIDEIREPYNLK